jgi:hypothetical protein
MSMAASFTGRKLSKFGGAGASVALGSGQDPRCVTFSVRSPPFQSAFVALSYFWGARGQALQEAVPEAAQQPATRNLLKGLMHPERAERAAALAGALAQLSSELDQARLDR